MGKGKRFEYNLWPWCYDGDEEMHAWLVRNHRREDWECMGGKARRMSFAILAKRVFQDPGTLHASTFQVN